MTGRNVNIYLQEDIYQQLKKRTEPRQISRYINEALAEKIEAELKKEKERFRQQLIVDYQDAAQDESLRIKRA